MVNVKKIFGANILRIRTSMGLSQEKFAELINMDLRSISSLEHGKYIARPENLNHICNTLDILPSELFSLPEAKSDISDNQKISAINEKLRKMNSARIDDVFKIVYALGE